MLSFQYKDFFLLMFFDAASSLFLKQCGYTKVREKIIKGPNITFLTNFPHKPCKICSLVLIYKLCNLFLYKTERHLETYEFLWKIKFRSNIGTKLKF